MSYVRVKNIVMNFEIKGQGEPLLLISGLATDMSTWSLQVPSYALNMMTICFDNRGTGKSDGPDVPYTMEMMADDALGLMDVIGLDSSHVIGMGMGGRVAMQMALSRPSRVRSLVLCSSSSVATPFERQLLASMHRSIQGGVGRDTLVRFEIPWLMSDRYFADPKVAEGVARVRMARLMGTPLHAQARQIEAYLESDLSSRLQDIKAPTLVVGGRRDMLVPIAYQERLAAAIPRASLLPLDAAHLVTTEAPRQFNEETLRFLFTTAVE